MRPLINSPWGVVAALPFLVALGAIGIAEFNNHSSGTEITSTHVVSGWVTAVLGDASQIIIDETNPAIQKKVGMERSYKAGGVVMTPASVKHYFVTPKAEPLLMVGNHITLTVQCRGTELPSMDANYVCVIQKVALAQ